MFIYHSGSNDKQEINKFLFHLCSAKNKDEWAHYFYFNINKNVHLIVSIYLSQNCVVWICNRHPMDLNFLISSSIFHYHQWWANTFIYPSIQTKCTATTSPYQIKICVLVNGFGISQIRSWSSWIFIIWSDQSILNSSPVHYHLSIHAAITCIVPVHVCHKFQISSLACFILAL